MTRFIWVPLTHNKAQRLISFWCLGVSVLLIFTLLPGPTFGYEQEVKQLSSQMSTALAKSGKKTVAVVDFTDLQGCVTELGRFLAEEFSVSLTADAKDFEVIDRTHLKVILQEHKLASSGIIDPQTARKLGEIAGVEAIVTGSLTPFGDIVRLSAKILDVSTAKMIAGFSADIPRTKAIEELLARGVSSCGSSRFEQHDERSPVTNPPPASGYPRFESALYSAAATSIQRRGNSLTVTLLLECLGQQHSDWRPPLGFVLSAVSFHTPSPKAAASPQVPSMAGCPNVSWHYLQLIDEDGGRWNLDERATRSTTNGSEFTTAGVQLLPDTKLRVVLVFTSEGDARGTQFTLSAKEGKPSYRQTVLIKGLK